ncbi:hypothetical protein EKH57_05650 [Halorubrum sp. BOL3-1]|uniref:hypothetical protein n=1 Tax=Halorubrum sp. BOL3-1 TaxID=2497325 RepID=UPI001004EDEE|nr:hypothetical protein [Halorubrum sp. BOL3-1]QAU12242.1 hypothetical protein EKH57_05650 [Halorubrum sp. BOL3-1]
MRVPDRTRLSPRLVVGCCCLLACISAVILSAPVHETTIEEQAPAEEAMAASLDGCPPSEIDPIPFSSLSQDEQPAVVGAIQSPRGVHTDRGGSDDGTRFAYRNDIVNRYLVSHEESIYSVRVVVDVEYPLVAGGVLARGIGFPLVVSGIRARQMRD